MRTTTVYLLTDDYGERLDALYGAAKEAERNAAKGGEPRRLGEAGPYAALREEYEALRAEAEAAATVVTLQALNRSEWRQLREKHPPRKGDGVDEDAAKADRQAGVNVEAVEDDLVYRSMLTPAFKSRDAFDEWADALSEAEWQSLVIRAWGLATTARTDPKSLPASLTLSGDANAR